MNQYLNEPPVLFKYYSLAEKWREEALQRMVENNECYLSTIAQLNDPLECLLQQGSPRPKEVKHRQPSKGESPPHYFLAGAIQSRISGVRIFSLSENRTNLRMWIEYADRLQGICIELRLPVPWYRNPAQMPYNTPSERYSLVKVCYSSQQQVLNTDNLGELVSTHENLGGSDTLRGIGKAIYTKHLSWAHEEEWRLVDLDASEERWSFDETEQSIVSRIIVGPRIPGDRLKWIRDLCDKSSLPCHRSVLDGCDVCLQT